MEQEADLHQARARRQHGAVGFFTHTRASMASPTIVVLGAMKYDAVPRSVLGPPHIPSLLTAAWSTPCGVNGGGGSASGHRRRQHGVQELRVATTKACACRGILGRGAILCRAPTSSRVMLDGKSHASRSNGPTSHRSAVASMPTPPVAKSSSAIRELPP